MAEFGSPHQRECASEVVSPGGGGTETPATRDQACGSPLRPEMKLEPVSPGGGGTETPATRDQACGSPLRPVIKQEPVSPGSSDGTPLPLERVGGSVRALFRSGQAEAVISETPVTIFRDAFISPRAPRRSVRYLYRTQIPPSESLSEVWSLEEYGRQGCWGFAFKYETGRLCLYQTTGEVSPNPLSGMTTMTSTDWGVLMHLKLHLPRDEDHTPPSTSSSSQPCKKQRLDAAAEERKRMVFSAVWQSKTSPCGRWYYRVSLWRSGSSVDDAEFILEYFNSDCGVFMHVLSLPHAAWVEKMSGSVERITSLFHSCRNWKETLTVKKAISF